MRSVPEARGRVIGWAGFVLAALLVQLLGSAFVVRALASPGATMTLFASPVGAGNGCSSTSPCSLTGVQTKVRNLISTGHMAGDIIVQVASGSYALAQPLSYGPQDSGINGYDVVWKAAPGAHPIFSGGVAVTGWTLHDASKNIWQASVPSGLVTRQLYVDGVRASRASGQPPDTLLQTTNGFTATGTKMAGWRNPSNIEFVFMGGNGGWSEDRCDVASISGTSIVMRQPCWSNLHIPNNLPLLAPDPTDNPMGGFNGLSSTATPSSIENAYELLSQPKQWYLDQTARVVYYIPPAGHDPNTSAFVAPVAQTLLQGIGTLDQPIHNIQFRGIQFSFATWMRPSGDDGYADMQATFTLTGTNASYQQGTCQYSDPPGTCPFASWTKTPAAVTFQAAHNIAFIGVFFNDTGATGLNFEYGSQNNLIQGNDFTDISGNALDLGNVNDPLPSWVGADNREINSYNTIVNNWIHDSTVEYHDGVGIWLGYTQHSLVAHNQINNMPYTGINVGWGGWHTDTLHLDNPNINADNTVQDNLIFEVMNYLSDGGAIYTNGFQGTTIPNGLKEEGNVAYQPHNSDFVFYNDEGSSYITISQNVEWYGALYANGGCNTLGHIVIDQNYWAQPFLGYICPPPPVDIAVTNHHVLPAVPGPNDIPVTLLASAGLEPAFRGLTTSAQPQVSYVGPAGGPTTGGTKVLIGGSGFTPTSTVFFGQAAATNVQFISSGFLIAVSPPGSGPVYVSVHTSAGISPTSTALEDLYVYAP